MVVHERAVGATVEWFTPSSLFVALGLSFDMDPASGEGDVVPARMKVRRPYDGLTAEWSGRVWLNPPYGPSAVPFIERMVNHANGILLVAARTETRWFQKAASAADVVCFLRDRLHFVRADGYQARSSHASVLMAWGPASVDAVRRANLGWIP